MSHYRSRVTWANLVYLLQSRRRQAVVFDLSAVMLILGIVFALGAVLGDFSLTEIPLSLVALLVGGLALVNGWRAQGQNDHPAPVNTALLVLGVLLLGGALMLTAGVEITLLWAALLIVFALVMRFG